MLKATGFALCLALTVLGCGDDSNNNMADMAVPDMTVASPDLSPLTCSGVLGCIVKCAGDSKCATACGTSGSPDAQTKANALFGCLYKVCNTPGDGGMSCNSQNPGMDQTPGCLQCVGLLLVQSMNMTAQCHTEYAACTAM